MAFLLVVCLLVVFVVVWFGVFINQIPNYPSLVQIPILFVQIVALLMYYFNCVILFCNEMILLLVKSNSK